MRLLLAFVSLFAISACSGGSGGGNASTPNSMPAPSAVPAPASAKLETPTFVLRIPPRGPSAKKTRRPAFVSSGTLSVVVNLTSDSSGVAAGSLAGNPATTNVSAGSCSVSCTVSGPASPVGNDTYTVTTFDAANAGGNSLDTATQQFTITQGVINNETITLAGIPASIVINGVPAIDVFVADATNSSTLSVTAADADGETIVGTFANPITVSDPDTNSEGTNIGVSCAAQPASETVVASTSVVFDASTDTAAFCYEGVAQNPVTLTSSGAGVSGNNAATVTFQPQLNTPAFVAGSGTAAVVSGTNPVEVELFAASGTGSSGTLAYEEAGWTDAPFDQLLGATTPGPCTSAGPLSTFATIGSSAVLPPGETQFSVTAIGAPVAGDCPVTVGDGLLANPSDTNVSFDASYTTTTFGIDSRPRRTR